MAELDGSRLVPDKNDIRYEVSVRSFRETDYVLYQITIVDLALGREDQLLLRFSQIRKFHEHLLADKALAVSTVPEVPKTNSIGIFNRTNRSQRRIQQRKRQIEYYFTKMFNSPSLRGHPLVKRLLQTSSHSRSRTLSIENLTCKSGVSESRSKSLSKEYERPPRTAGL